MREILGDDLRLPRCSHADVVGLHAHPQCALVSVDFGVNARIKFPRNFAIFGTYHLEIGNVQYASIVLFVFGSLTWKDCKPLSVIIIL